jgi:hypothetical protein
MSSTWAETDVSDAAPLRRPPVAILALALLALLAAAGLLLAGDGRWQHLTGYVLSTFVLIGLVARYRWAVVRLRADRSYAHSPSLDRVGTLLVAAGLLVAAAHLWPLATEWSR